MAAAAFLAGCGGGSDGGPAPVIQQTSSSPLRAGTRALAAVSSESAADQLMDFAERVFPAVFPEHQSSLDGIPFFRYRQYSNGVYLGVVVSENPSFPLHGVYTLGGPWAQLTYHGQLEQFITPIDTGTSNGCYDLALADTQGTHIVAQYQSTGDGGGIQTVDTLVGGLTVALGHSARETVVTATGTDVSSGLAVDGTFTIKNYTARTGTAELTQYGSILNGTGTTQGILVNINATSLLSPPYVDRQYSLAPGQTLNATQTVITTGSVSAPAFGITEPLNDTTTQSITVKYVGQEFVSIPAGTFNTCRFETTTTSPGSSSFQTSWVIVGKGIPVRTAITGSALNQAAEALSVNLNGAPL